MENFCLWDEWYEIEEELAEIAPTVRVQHDAMRNAVLEGYCGATEPPIEESPVRQKDDSTTDNPTLKRSSEHQYSDEGSEHVDKKPLASTSENPSALSADAPCFVQSTCSASVSRKGLWSPPAAARRRKAKLRAHFEKLPSLSTSAGTKSVHRLR